ncbi:MAG: outer membrane protein [Hyphomicrobiaceae bacterium]
MGLVGLAAMSSPVTAADWTRGANSAYRSMYVPAPAPVPETFKWYVRADLGMGLQHDLSISENGLLFGDTATTEAAAPFGMSSSWFNDDFDTFFVGGVGVGMYFSPRWRGDITVDARTATSADADAANSFAQFSGGVATGNTVRQTIREDTDVRNTVALANLYYDLSQRGSGVTPYIGAGFGFAVRSIDRDHLTTEVIDDGIGGLTPGNTYSGTGKAHQVAPAAAVMAGLAYSVSPGTVIDIGYRFTWIGSVDMSTRISNGTDTYNSRLTIGDSFDHQIRAGLRWNVW